MQNEENKDLIFSDIYPIVVTHDNDVSVMDLPFSVRLKNALMRSNITTLSAILATKISDFEEIRNLGAKSVKELLDFLEKGLSGDAKKSNAPKPRIVIDYIEEILTLDENLKNNLTDEDRKHTKPYYDAVEILGTEFAMFCYKNPQSIIPMVQSLSEFVYVSEREIDIEKRIKECINAMANIEESYERYYDTEKESR